MRFWLPLAWNWNSRNTFFVSFSLRFSCASKENLCCNNFSSKTFFWMTSRFTFFSLLPSRNKTTRERNQNPATVKSWRESCALQMIAFSNLMVIDRIESEHSNNTNNYEAIDLCCYAEFFSSFLPSSTVSAYLGLTLIVVHQGPARWFENAL